MLVCFPGQIAAADEVKAGCIFDPRAHRLCAKAPLVSEIVQRHLIRHWNLGGHIGSP